jgi:hypothetical protein
VDTALLRAFRYFGCRGEGNRGFLRLATSVGCDYRILFRIGGWFVDILVGCVFGLRGGLINMLQQRLEMRSGFMLPPFQADNSSLQNVGSLGAFQFPHNRPSLAVQNRPFLAL